MPAFRRGVYLLVFLAALLASSGPVYAAGEAADAMCNPYYAECPCNQVPNPDKQSPQKCIPGTSKNAQGYSNTHGCPIGVCVDTTDGKKTQGICPIANKCDAQQTAEGKTPSLPSASQLQGSQSTLQPPTTPTTATQNTTPLQPLTAPGQSILGSLQNGAPSNTGQESVAPSANNFNDLIMQAGLAPGGAVPGTGFVPPDTGGSFLSPTPLGGDTVQLQGGTVPGTEATPVQTSQETGGTAGSNTFQQPAPSDQQPVSQEGTPQPSCGEFDIYCKAQAALGFTPTPEQQNTLQPENTQTMRATIYYPGQGGDNGGLVGNHDNVLNTNLSVAAGYDSGLKYGDVVQITNPATDQTTTGVVSDVCPGCGKGIDLTPGVANAVGLTQTQGVGSMEVSVVAQGLSYPTGLQMAANINAGGGTVADTSSNMNGGWTGASVQGPFASAANTSGSYFDSGLQNSGLYQEPVNTGGGIGSDFVSSGGTSIASNQTSVNTGGGIGSDFVSSGAIGNANPFAGASPFEAGYPEQVGVPQNPVGATVSGTWSAALSFEPQSAQGGLSGGTPGSAADIFAGSTAGSPLINTASETGGGIGGEINAPLTYSGGGIGGEINAPLTNSGGGIGGEINAPVTNSGGGIGGEINAPITNSVGGIGGEINAPLTGSPEANTPSNEPIDNRTWWQQNAPSWAGGLPAPTPLGQGGIGSDYVSSGGVGVAPQNPAGTPDILAANAATDNRLQTAPENVPLPQARPSDIPVTGGGIGGEINAPLTGSPEASTPSNQPIDSRSLWQQYAPTALGGLPAPAPLGQGGIGSDANAPLTGGTQDVSANQPAKDYSIFTGAAPQSQQFSLFNPSTWSNPFAGGSTLPPGAETPTNEISGIPGSSAAKDYSIFTGGTPTDQPQPLATATVAPAVSNTISYDANSPIAKVGVEGLPSVIPQLASLPQSAQPQAADMMRQALIANPDTLQQFAPGATVKSGDIVFPDQGTINPSALQNPQFQNSLTNIIDTQEKTYIAPSSLDSPDGVKEWVATLGAPPASTNPAGTQTELPGLPGSGSQPGELVGLPGSSATPAQPAKDYSIFTGATPQSQQFSLFNPSTWSNPFSGGSTLPPGAETPTNEIAGIPGSSAAKDYSIFTGETPTQQPQTSFTDKLSGAWTSVTNFVNNTGGVVPGAELLNSDGISPSTGPVTCPAGTDGPTCIPGGSAAAVPPQPTPEELQAAVQAQQAAAQAQKEAAISGIVRNSAVANDGLTALKNAGLFGADKDAIAAGKIAAVQMSAQAKIIGDTQLVSQINQYLGVQTLMSSYYNAGNFGPLGDLKTQAISLGSAVINTINKNYGK